MNYAFASRRQRDVGNDGVSIVVALGDFEGGELRHWPRESRRGPVEELPDQSGAPPAAEDSSSNHTQCDSIGSDDISVTQDIAARQLEREKEAARRLECEKEAARRLACEKQVARRLEEQARARAMDVQLRAAELRAYHRARREAAAQRPAPHPIEELFGISTFTCGVRLACDDEDQWEDERSDYYGDY